MNTEEQKTEEMILPETEAVEQQEEQEVASETVTAEEAETAVTPEPVADDAEEVPAAAEAELSDEPDGQSEEAEEQTGETEKADTPKSDAIQTAAERMEKMRQFTEEDENKQSSSSSLRSILGGEFLTANMVRGQLGLILLISLCFILYINNRYKNQAELIEIDNLKKELDEARFRALTRSSELTSKTRQSYIEEFLRSNKDSVLQISSNSPYVIKLNGESILPEYKDEHLTLEELKNQPDSVFE